MLLSRLIGKTILHMCGIASVFAIGVVQAKENGDSKSPQTYMPVIEGDFEQILQQDSKQKSQVMKRQQNLLESRYDLSDKPSQVKMSGGRKAVQEGVRIKLKEGISWSELGKLTPEEIRDRELFPMGFRPLPHAKHSTGGMVFPK